MKKFKELNIYQVIVYEYLREKVDENKYTFITTWNSGFMIHELSQRVKMAHQKLSDQQMTEVIYFVSKYIIKKNKKKEVK